MSEFKNLGVKDNYGGEIAAQPSEKENKIRYPSFYIDKDIGLDEDMVDKEFTAEIKVRVRRVSTTVNKDKKTQDADIEVLAIKLPKMEKNPQEMIEDALTEEEAKNE